jgi:hypothetical protein
MQFLRGIALESYFTAIAVTVFYYVKSHVQNGSLQVLYLLSRASCGTQFRMRGVRSEWASISSRPEFFSAQSGENGCETSTEIPTFTNVSGGRATIRVFCSWLAEKGYQPVISHAINPHVYRGLEGRKNAGIRPGRSPNGFGLNRYQPRGWPAGQSAPCHTGLYVQPDRCRGRSKGAGLL